MMEPVQKIKKKDVESIIALALKEDIGPGDITSQAIFSKTDKSEARIISKESGIFCSAGMINYVYGLLDPKIKIVVKIDDGDKLDQGMEIAQISGPTISMLSGERTVINFLQRLSGIATRTNQVVALLKKTRIKILDTRKTLPGHRLLDKFAVHAGGGSNHRMGLYDMILIKDNHIKAAGSITDAVDKVRKKYGSKYRIEVETRTLQEVEEAMRAEVEIIMLDNMDRKKIFQSARIIDKRALIEVSGNIDENRIKQLADLDIDFISMGALTHSVKAFDISMMFS